MKRYVRIQFSVIFLDAQTDSIFFSKNLENLFKLAPTERAFLTLDCTFITAIQMPTGHEDRINGLGKADLAFIGCIFFLVGVSLAHAVISLRIK